MGLFMLSIITDILFAKWEINASEDLDSNDILVSAYMQFPGCDPVISL